MQFPTYKAITYEILSTIHANYNPHEHRDRHCIFFRCMGEDRALSMADFNGIFGFPNEGISWNVPDFSPGQAWRQLTGETPESYSPSSSKSTSLRNHALRYIHRVMVHSIFGRGLSTGVVNKAELLLLWGMVNQVKVNTGVWMLKHLLHVAAMPSGRIVVGGILTIIAAAFGFMPEMLQPVAGSHLIDIDTLINMRMCRHIGLGQYRLLDDAGYVIEPEGEVDPHAHQADQEQAQMQGEEEAPHDQMPEEHHHMGGFPEPMPPPQPDYNMAYLVERMDQLDARLTRSEDIQLQILQSMQRIEERLAHQK